MKHIAVLLTVFNRKKKTLDCLRNLFSINIAGNVKFDVFMTDDGCTDGTPEAVKLEFPQVNIIDGDGTLFWNRGMIAAWKAATEANNYDYYLWLNDDTILFNDSISLLLSESEKLNDNSVIVGSTCDSKTNKITTYGGYGADDKKLDVNGELQLCDHFNGNIVLVPSFVYNKIGTMDEFYSHSVGDFDYGLKLSSANLKAFVSSSYLGICDRHNCLPKYADPSIELTKRWNNYWSPLGAAPVDNFVYFKKKYGIIKAFKHVTRKFLNCLFPKLFLNRNNKDSFFFG